MKTKENNNKEMYTREEVKQQMLDYLDEKYGEEFDVLDVVYKDWSRNWEKLYAVPKGKGKEYEFMVYRFKDENGEIYYTDDYFIIAKKDEYSEYLKTIIACLYSKNPMTVRDLSKELNIHYSTISRKHTAILRKLKRILKNL